MVESNVPGAQIAIDGQPLGPTPVDGRLEYTGLYTFTASAPGFEPLTQKVRFQPKWYDYPPLDFVAEVLWPFRIEDVRRVRLDLEPARPVNQAELIRAGEELRSRAATLPPSQVPDTKSRPTATSPPQQSTPAATVPGNLLPALPGGPTLPTPPIQSAPPPLPPGVGPNPLTDGYGPGGAAGRQ